MSSPLYTYIWKTVINPDFDVETALHGTGSVNKGNNTSTKTVTSHPPVTNVDLESQVANHGINFSLANHKLLWARVPLYILLLAPILSMGFYVSLELHKPAIGTSVALALFLLWGWGLIQIVDAARNYEDYMDHVTTRALAKQWVHRRNVTKCIYEALEKVHQKEIGRLATGAAAVPRPKHTRIVLNKTKVPPLHKRTWNLGDQKPLPPPEGWRKGDKLSPKTAGEKRAQAWRDGRVEDGLNTTEWDERKAAEKKAFDDAVNYRGQRLPPPRMKYHGVLLPAETTIGGF